MGDKTKIRAAGLPVFDVNTPIGIYEGTRAVVTQSYTEANVKAGVQFYLSAAWPTADPVATGTPRTVVFSTGATQVLVKTRIVSYIGEEFTIELFEAPVFSGGTPIFVGNYNGRNPVATSVTAFKDATITDPGTPFPGEPDYYFGGTNANRDASAIPDGRERVLKLNTDYLVRISGNGRFSYYIDWYEGDTDIPVS